MSYVLWGALGMLGLIAGIITYAIVSARLLERSIRRAHTKKVE